MTYTFKLARRIARLRVVTLAAAAGFAVSACDNADRLGPTSPDQPTATDAGAAVLPPAFATTSAASGIPFGAFDVPNLLLSSAMSSVRAVGPADILPVLQAAQRVGARVVVRLSAGEKYWTNPDHTVNLDKWKSQVARFKVVDLKPYIADGTLLAHYLIDEPHDASNWGGEPVPYSTVEAMARYSKELWPGLTTVVRSYPDWLAKAPFQWKYLDAAWAQYSARKGEVNGWMKTQTSYAKQAGLGLVVGLNLLDGGTEASGIPGTKAGTYAMSASQIKAWGSVLATNSQSCAVYSWRYTPSYFGRSDVAAAIAYVAALAKNRASQSCQPALALPSVNPTPIVLKVSGRVQGDRQYMTLDWTGAKGPYVDVQRVGLRTLTTENDGHFVLSQRSRFPITYTYKVCQKGSSVCSKSVSVSFR
jgi:hypothetical protein